MNRRAQENLIAVLILGIFVAAIWTATGYGPRARLVPIPIASLGLILMLAQLVLQNFRSEKDLQIDLLEFISRRATGDELPHPPNGTDATDISAEDGDRLRRELTAAALVLVLVGLFFTVGPLPAMFVFTAGYFILSRYSGVLMGLLYALAATAGVYALFYLWLGVDMRHGYFDLNFGLW